MSTSTPDIVQHGTGFVGEAVARSIHDICPHLRVVGVDIDAEKRRTLESFDIDSCHPDQVSLYRDCSVHSFSLPTPDAPGTHWGYDLSIISAALEQFAERVLRHRTEPTLIIMRSTVYPGTSEEVMIPLLERVSGKRCGVDWDYAYNPEFLEEKRAYEDACNPPLVAAGVSSDRGAELFWNVFSCFNVPFERLEGFREAEWLKMTNNVLNAMIISACNELREQIVLNGVSRKNAQHVMEMLSKTAFTKTKAMYGLEDRGCFGGHCLPKETQALQSGNRTRAYPSLILEATIAVNAMMKHQQNIRLVAE